MVVPSSSFPDEEVPRSARLRLRGIALIDHCASLATIAVLAVILLPLVAQSELDRKRAQSLSNVKQIAHAEILYSTDHDGHFVLQGYPAGFSANGAGEGRNAVAQTWVSLLRPFLKDRGIFVDPGVGDSDGLILGSKPTSPNHDTSVQYGYNYLFLSPWYGCFGSIGRSASAAVRPERTVMFTSSQNFRADLKKGWYDINAPGAWPVTIGSPLACVWYSGVKGSGNWSHSNPANIGVLTSTVRAVKPYGGAVVSWVDGHASFRTDVELAAGTDYLTASYNNSSEGARITSLSNYVWTLDGTLKDLTL